MKTAIFGGAALACAVFVAGCNSNPKSGIALRIQEKSAVFAQLTPEQKKNIEGGAIEVGFTTDMVYMALGKPYKEREKSAPEGKVVMWTYHNYYPAVAASQLSLNDPSRHGYRSGQLSPNAPRNPVSISSTAPSGPEASVDTIADIPSETLHVLFLNGVVFDIKLEE